MKKSVKNLVSKQIFARWQALLCSFDFQIEGENNSLPDFFTRDFLQGTNETRSIGNQVPEAPKIKILGRVTEGCKRKTSRKFEHEKNKSSKQT